jgi:hypothetical protein
MLGNEGDSDRGIIRHVESGAHPDPPAIISAT